jgi:hypothetical protein
VLVTVVLVTVVLVTVVLVTVVLVTVVRSVDGSTGEVDRAGNRRSGGLLGSGRGRGVVGTTCVMGSGGMRAARGDHATGRIQVRKQ